MPFRVTPLGVKTAREAWRFLCYGSRITKNNFNRGKEETIGETRWFLTPKGVTLNTFAISLNFAIH